MQKVCKNHILYVDLYVLLNYIEPPQKTEEAYTGYAKV